MIKNGDEEKDRSKMQIWGDVSSVEGMLDIMLSPSVSDAWKREKHGKDDPWGRLLDSSVVSSMAQLREDLTKEVDSGRGNACSCGTTPMKRFKKMRNVLTTATGAGLLCQGVQQSRDTPHA